VHTVARLQAGQAPNATLLLAPLRSPARMRLLQLGGLHAMAALLMLTLADQIDVGMPQAWEAMRQAQDEAATMAALEALQGGLTLRVALLLPVVLLFWHAPVLVSRDARIGVAQALFGSALASLRNLGAFVVYGLCWVGADLLLSTLLGGVLGLLGLPQLAMLVAVPVALLFSASFYASLHASVMGCIDFDDAELAPPASAINS
ncbi:MAG: BPSS1780 family membrane protein, partial [Leptothrix sp. (in: b-proteobacteria)]